MDDGQSDGMAARGNVLIQLRHGIRQSTRLARELAADAIVGSEAYGLLGRLNAINAELAALESLAADPRRAHNDPFWSEPPHPFQQSRCL